MFLSFLQLSISIPKAILKKTKFQHSRLTILHNTLLGKWYIAKVNTPTSTIFKFVKYEKHAETYRCHILFG